MTTRHQTWQPLRGLRVEAYYNLHKGRFSVRALEGPDKGRVVGHLDRLGLAGVKFKVSEAGRQRVLREKRKNVHARVQGTLVNPDALTVTAETGTRVSYNPYREGQNGRGAFYNTETGEDYMNADLAVLDDTGTKPVIYAREL